MKNIYISMYMEYIVRWVNLLLLFYVYAKLVFFSCVFQNLIYRKSLLAKTL